MAWMKMLADTYDAYGELAGRAVNEQAILLPLAHSTANAQIEITLDLSGNLLHCEKLEKGKDVVTVIPVTEDSASRGNGNFPHPLCDKLCYIAGDYSAYTGEDKQAYYEAYMQQLCTWKDSAFTHPMVKAIYAYLAKKTVIADLIEKQILELDDHGILSDKVKKLQGQGQTGAFVRFCVWADDLDSMGETRVWKNRELYQCYIDYYMQSLTDQDICYVTGEEENYTEKHPSKIRNTGDKAKLISGNDESGFTYRGRFSTKKQAVSVGYQTSQKAHNALKWLLAKQGYTRDGMAFVCWMVNRPLALPDICKNSLDAYRDLDEFDIFDMKTGEDSESNADTGDYVAKQLRNAIKGYANHIQIDDRVVMLSLDAATTGRMSVTYYDEMGGQEFIAALMYWHGHCTWKRYIRLNPNNKEEKRILIESAPSPKEIALAAYGTERGNGYLDTDAKLIRSTIERLLPCISKRKRIPKDIIKAAVIRASQPLSMSDFVWKNQVLSVACAMIHYQYEKEKGDGKMGSFLEDNAKDRSVLFGRLLAVYDYMEMRAMFEKDENGKLKEQRTTNAKRYWNAYSMRPAATFRTLKENLMPYMKKLNSYELKCFEDWTQEIMASLADVGFDNHALSEWYLPAYYLQMQNMKEHFKMSHKNTHE